MINEILEHNRSFVDRREYEALRTDRFPNKKLVVVTCMDTRLSELLPRAMNISQGDAKIIKVAQDSGADSVEDELTSFAAAESALDRVVLHYLPSYRL